MEQLLLHPDTQKQVADVIARPNHALMILGPDGSGKRTLALYLACQFLKLSTAKAVLSHPYTTILKPVDGVLSIGDIRTLQEKVRLKIPGSNQIKRIIIIESAHLLSVEAQNAFLKLLEEPPTDTVIIMTVSVQSHLLPTVHSRAQQIYVQPVSQQVVTQALLAQGFSQDKIEPAYYLAEGRIGLISALLTEDTQHPLVAAIAEAKSLLGMSTYNRLGVINELSRQKQDLPLLLGALQRIAQAAMRRTNTQKEIAHWHHVLLVVRSSQLALSRSANQKLLMSDLMLNL